MATPASPLTDQYTDAQLADGTTLRFKGQLSPDEVRAKVQAYRAGRSSGEQPPEQQKDSPGFFGRLSQQIFGTAHPIDQAVSEAQQLYEDPKGTIGKTLKQVAMTPVNLANRALPLSEAVKQAQGGDYSGAAKTVATGVPNLLRDMTGGQQFADDVRSKNYSGAAGTLAGGIAQVAASKVPTEEIQSAAADALQERAANIGNRLLRPRNAEMVHANPGAAIPEQGIVARNMESLEGKLGEARQGVGAQKGSLLSDAGVAERRIDVRPAIEKPIDTAISNAVRGGDQMLVDKLNDIKRQLTKEHELGENGKLVVTGDKDLNLSPTDLREMKTKVGEAARWTGEIGDPRRNVINRVRQSIYDRLRNAEESVAPVADLNRQYANVKTAEKAAGRRALDEARGLHVGNGDLVTGLLGEGAGLALGHPASGAVAAVLLKKALQSPLGSTLRANAMQQLSKMPMSALLKDAYLSALTDRAAVSADEDAP